ncbi:MAG TPA: hypothetical protein VFD43_07895, partial [Planctomycetota bacterium]|nr:hypothetical protein [Planctomycetota bacterium]
RAAAAAAPALPPVAAAAGASGDVPPPRPRRVRDRFHDWRRESPVLSTGCLGCGCLVVFMLLLALFLPAVFWRTRTTHLEQRYPTATESRHHGPGVPALEPLDELLERLRVSAARYDLSMDSVMPGYTLTSPDFDRPADYPSPVWPPMLGASSDGMPQTYEFDEVPGDEPDWAEGSAVAFLGPLESRLVSRTSQVLLCPEGVGTGGGVTAQQYCVLLVGGDLAGRCVFESYATLVVDGDLSASVDANSYVTVLVAGDLTGRLVARSYGMVYIEGQLEGTIEFEKQGRVYIGGRTRQSSLGKIDGRAEVYLAESDMDPGQRTIGELEVTILE